MSKNLLSWLRRILITATLITGIGLASHAHAASNVSCSVPALIEAINTASSGDALNLTAGCTYPLTSSYNGSETGLPAISIPLTQSTGTMRSSSAAARAAYRSSVFWKSPAAAISR